MLSHRPPTTSLDNRTGRKSLFFPSEITEADHLQMVRNNVMQVEVTLEAFPDHEGNKVYTTYKEVGGAASPAPRPEERDGEGLEEGEPDGEGLEEGEPDVHAEE